MFQSISGEIDRIEVRPHVTKDGQPKVVSTGYVGGYPLTALHMTLAEAYKLAADLTAAADSLTNSAVAA